MKKYFIVISVVLLLVLSTLSACQVSKTGEAEYTSSPLEVIQPLEKPGEPGRPTKPEKCHDSDACNYLEAGDCEYWEFCESSGEWVCDEPCPEEPPLPVTVGT